MPKGHLHQDYIDFQRGEPHTFYATLMLAMNRADSKNLEKLTAAFPEVWAEMRARYNAPGGVLPGDGTVYRGLLKEWKDAPIHYAMLRNQFPDLAEYYTEV